MRGRYVEHMTWIEAESAIRELRCVLLPVGARTKEHGPHLPLSNDFTLAEYLTARVVERCPVLALPTLPYGFYPAFVEYPGSVSLGFETFRDTVVDICACFAAYGATHFYVLNTGVSTARPLGAAREELARRGIDMAFTDFGVAVAEGRAQVETQSHGTHADEIETSMMLYIAPASVALEKAVSDGGLDRGGGGLSRDPAGKGIYSPSGSYGDPSRATLEKGRVVVESLVEHLVAEVQQRLSTPAAQAQR